MPWPRWDRRSPSLAPRGSIPADSTGRDSPSGPEPVVGFLLCGVPSMTPSALEFTRLKPADEVALADFFAALTACGDDRFFHPHPFTAPEAARVCRLEGRDLYGGDGNAMGGHAGITSPRGDAN